MHDPEQSRWQLACVWPDTGRLARTRLALEEARRTPLELVRGDAVEDVGDLIAGLPVDATAVVTTTWVVGYFSPEQRTGFRDALAAAAATRPVAWISGENQGVVDLIPSDAAPSDANGVEWSVLGLVTFRDGHVRSRAARLRPPARQRTRLASRERLGAAVSGFRIAKGGYLPGAPPGAQTGGPL